MRHKLEVHTEKGWVVACRDTWEVVKALADYFQRQGREVRSIPEGLTLWGAK